MISVVILALSAAWIAGSLISGAMVATYRSVLEIRLTSQTVMTVGMASTQAIVRTSADTDARKRW